MDQPVLLPEVGEFQGLHITQPLDVLNKAAESLGCTVAAPFMALSFISLPTVPELGLTDKGLVDVIHHCLIPVIL